MEREAAYVVWLLDAVRYIRLRPDTKSITLDLVAEEDK